MDRAQATIKHTIRSALIDFLYAPVTKKFEHRLHELIVKNTLAIKGSHKSFMYKGELYAMEPGPFPRPANRLAKELEPAMDAYLADYRALVSDEQPLVIGAIVKVLNACSNPHDCLLLLPESVHKPVKVTLTLACYPYYPQALTNEFIEEFKRDNEQAINRMKTRMVLNLII